MILDEKNLAEPATLSGIRLAPTAGPRKWQSVHLLDITISPIHVHAHALKVANRRPIGALLTPCMCILSFVISDRSLDHDIGHALHRQRWTDLYRQLIPFNLYQYIYDSFLHLLTSLQSLSMLSSLPSARCAGR